MRRKCYVFLILLASSSVTNCKPSNKTKETKSDQTGLKPYKAERPKRSVDDEEEKPFWANRGKKQSDEEADYGYNRVSSPHKRSILRSVDTTEKEPNFWGNHDPHDNPGEIEQFNFHDSKAYGKLKFCPHCKDVTPSRLTDNFELSKERRDEMDPFWGNRGRRGSDETPDSSPFWGNRGRRQEEEPFWGTRGKRDELPFWGNRGRRENLLNNRESSWSRGNREDDDPFWGNRGRRDEVEPFWGNRGRRDLKESLIDAINSLEENIENHYKEKPSFWKNMGRESTLKHLFNGQPREQLGLKKASDIISGAGTVHDDRIYAEQPHYIVVERSSRSSDQDDPYFISRGKKHSKAEWTKAARGRRNAFEDIFKTVKSDPYFIARGKKAGIRINNASFPIEDFNKTKELICATLDLMISKNKDTKRSIDDSDRGRRAVLQKLAAQLQSDPYFVSRGKRDSESEESIHEFVNSLTENCF